MIVDVSSHNGAINWATAKAAGVKAAIIRCGYGSDAIKYDDARYKTNIEGALASGIVVGVYLYSYAKTVESAKSEAAHALRLISPYKDKIKLPIFYDLEERDRVAGASDRAKTFCDILKANGYKVGIYADLDYWSNYLKGFSGYSCYHWVAKWSEPKPTGQVDIWQYDAHGKVAGIGSGVDMDRAYGELLEIINGKEPTPTPTPQPGGKIMLGVDILKKGSKGAEVFAVQSILKAKGFKGENGKVLALDSSYGANTAYAVASFQKSAGLTADSICGAKTWDKLING